MRGRLGSRWWALRIVLHDGRAITVAETSNRETAADPEVLSAIRQAAEQHAVPAELTGMPPGSRPGVLTIADRGWWAWAHSRFDDDGIMVRNFFRTDRIEWDDVRWFADGQPSSADSRRWALGIVLRNGSENHRRRDVEQDWVCPRGDAHGDQASRRAACDTGCADRQARVVGSTGKCWALP
jgi:hypothetical protein